VLKAVFYICPISVCFIAKCSSLLVIDVPLIFKKQSKPLIIKEFNSKTITDKRKNPLKLDEKYKNKSPKYVNLGNCIHFP
jgi:hypothetical protein